MSLNTLPNRHVSVTAICVVTIVASLGLLAQTPATPPAGAPAAQTPRPTPPPVPADDPFEGADLSPKDPIVAGSAAEEQKRSFCRRGTGWSPC